MKKRSGVANHAGKLLATMLVGLVISTIGVDPLLAWLPEDSPSPLKQTSAIKRKAALKAVPASSYQLGSGREDAAIYLDLADYWRGLQDDFRAATNVALTGEPIPWLVILGEEFRRNPLLVTCAFLFALLLFLDPTMRRKYPKAPEEDEKEIAKSCGIEHQRGREGFLGYDAPHHSEPSNPFRLDKKADEDSEEGGDGGG